MMRRPSRALAVLLVAVITLPAVLACDARGSADQQARADSTYLAVQTPAGPTIGLDSALLAQSFRAASAMPRLRSLVVARHGEVVREAYFNGGTSSTRANIKSASKSIISALVGIAIEEGTLEGTTQKVAPFFPAYAAANPDPRIGRIELGHLLSMRAGLEPTSFGNYGEWVSSSNWVRAALTRPFVDDPGGRMLYSTGSTHLLSAILTRATGMSTLAYARSRLFTPLGIELAAWTTDPQGIYFGGNEMRLRPRELLAFAELYRKSGVHNGRQIVPRAWIDSSWVQRTSSPFNGHGYGYGWWQRPAGRYRMHFAWGYGGQYAFIVPELELTIITTSDAVSPRDGSHNAGVHELANVLVRAAARGARPASDPAS